MKKYCCITLDDNIRFFEQAVQSRAASVFDAPYLAMLRRLHLQFSAKFQLNMFYSYCPGGFSLADVPDTFRPELEAASGWLKFSFHARHNDPPYPYRNAHSPLLQDYQDVTAQLGRIAGPLSLARTATLHYPAATRSACQTLKRHGVDALIGMFYDAPPPESLSYYLPNQLWPQLRRGYIYRDPATGMSFAHNDLILNQCDPARIAAALPALDGAVARGLHAPFLQIMSHEQYFYDDYCDYQPDFEEKFILALSIIERLGYQFTFLEDLI